MKQGDVICENGMRLLVVSSYDHKEPCMVSTKMESVDRKN
jgi:hypothetical protein